MTSNSHLLRSSILAASLLVLTSPAFADNEVWIGNPASSVTTNWSDAANWSGTSHNPNNNNVFFGNATAVGLGVINSVVDTSTNCYSLNFTNNASYNNLLIQPGQTLTLDGGTSLANGLSGNAALHAVPLGAVITTNTISGSSGTLLISGASAGGVFLGTTNGSAGSVPAYLDLSGLGTFIVSNTAVTASLWVGNGANRSDGVLYLAMTNYLALPTNGTGNASALVIGDNTSNNGSSPGGVVNLGYTNTILADNISVGLSKQNAAIMRFNPAFTNNGANPVAFIRGYSGTVVKKWAIGDGLTQSGTSAAGSGNVDFRNGTVYATVTAMVLGRPSSTSTTTPNSAGTLSLSAGSISVINLTNAMMTTVAGTTTNQTATGNINVNGSASFSANNVVMAILLGSGGSSTGTISVTNGTLAIGTLAVGTGTSTINVNGGTFILTNTCGSPALPLTTLNLTGGTLQLTASGTANATNLVATTVSTSGTTTIAIGSVAGVTSTTTLPLISYTGGSDPYANLVLAPLPNGFTGTLVDNSLNGRIDLVIAPPAVSAALVWVGATNAVVNGNWDSATSNWLDAATMTVPSFYADLDAVLFDDTASNGLVTLATNVAPFSLLVSNNAINYTFNGTNRITGAASLIKTGSGMLTLAESGGDNFNGGIVVSNGTLVLDNANGAISGGLNLVGGIVRVGNNDTNGSLPAGTLVNNGALIFSRTDNLTLSTAISGTGSITKNNNNTLTLSVNNAVTGGVVANGGTLRLGSSGAAGSGIITVNPGATVVLGTYPTNTAIVLAGGTLGESASLNPLTNDLTAATGTTSVIYEADPQNLTPADANEMTWSNTLHGSGSLIVVTVTNDATADSGNGFRLRGTTASDFSGTLTLSNNVKGELQTTVAGSFSPAGSGTLQLVCGTYLGNNTTSNQVTGINSGYCELNLRNNSGSDAVLGNNVVILGTGFTTLDPLGTAPAGSKVTMGNLTVGNGQEVGVYLAAIPAHVVVFPTVTLTGGTARFSPKTPGFGTNTSVGSDLAFGNVSETSPSSIVMNGQRTLTLTGTCTYSGTTTVSNGTLEVDGAIQGTGAVNVEAGATLDGVGSVAGPLSIAAGATLSPGNATMATNAVLSVQNTLTLAGTNIMDVNKTGSVFVNDVITNITTVTYGGTLQLNLTGAALAAGDAIQLFSCGFATGAFAAITPASPGTGLLWNTNTLATGSLSVVSAVNTSPTNITATVSGNVLTLSWPADHTGWRLQAQTNALATGLFTNWVDVANSATTNLLNITNDPANGAVFYRMAY